MKLHAYKHPPLAYKHPRPPASISPLPAKNEAKYSKIDGENSNMFKIWKEYRLLYMKI